MQFLRRYCCEETPHTCNSCGYPRSTDETEACKGSDVCEARICIDCRAACAACGLACCGEHQVQYLGEMWCSHCMAAEIEEGSTKLKEAV